MKDLERNRDYAFVEYQLDGGAWVRVNKPATTNGWAGNVGWANYTVAINTTGVTNLKFRFVFITNANRIFDGVYVDDVRSSSRRRPLLAR